MRDNIITVAVDANRDVTTATPIYRPDYGLKLKITNVELPTAYQVYISNSTCYDGTAKAMIGNDDGVEIPTEFIATGKTVYAWLFMHTGDSDGEVTYRIIIPNVVTPEFTDDVPTPEQQSEIDQLIIALNTGVETAEGYRDDAQASADAASESAEAAGQSASAAAILARAANESAENAAISEGNAKTYAERAEDAADEANRLALDAEESAESAELSADRAEQAAATSGYLWFYIENGKLYLDRTPNTKVDFYLEDGKLYVREVA